MNLMASLSIRGYSSHKESWMPWYRNTENTVEFHFARHLRPGSEAELVELVKQSASEGRKLKALGTRNNFNHISKTEDTLVDLSAIEAYRSTIEIDRAAHTVTLGARVTLAEAVDALDREGFHFPILGGWHGQTVGGAIATATHGSSFVHGSLSDYVTEIEAITASGEKIRITENDEALKAWRAHLGVLGIVTSVKMRIVPSFYLSCAIRDDTDDEVGFAELFRRIKQWDNPETPYVSLLWLPYYGDSGRTLIRTLHCSQATRPNGHAIRYEAEWAARDGKILKNAAEDRAMVLMGKAFVRHPRLHKNLWSNAMANAFLDDNGVEDRSFRLFCYEQFREPTENHWLRLVLSGEFALAVTELPGVIDELRVLLRDSLRTGSVANFPRFHIRFSNESGNTLLGTNAGRRTAYFNMYFSAAGLRRGQIPLANAMEQVLDAHGARPHWGKFRHLGAAAGYQATYGENWDRFEAYRASLDPLGMFADGREMFGGVNLHNTDRYLNGVFTGLNPDNYSPIHYLGGRSSDIR